MKRMFFYIFLIVITSFLFAEKALAICPVCAIAVGAGIGLSRWLGIDDSITGLWVGGLIITMIMWTFEWFKKKKIDFKGKTIITVLGYYILIIIPLYFAKIINVSSANLNLKGIDKLLLGIIVGSAAFYFGASWYNELKGKNNGRAHFSFQKVVMPVAPLIILSIIFYFLTK